MPVLRLKEQTSWIPLALFSAIFGSILVAFALLERIFSAADGFALQFLRANALPLLPWRIGTMFLIGGILLGYILVSTMLLVWLERKIAGHIQGRLGPMRTGGWHGWLQPLIDGLKLIFKEDIIPQGADRFIFVLSPFIVFVPAIAVLAVIPFTAKLVPVDLDMALVYALGVSSVTAIGVIMAGWASNNKYALLGGLRAAAQMVSYEVPRAFSVLGVILLAGSFSLVDIVEAQKNLWFVIPQFPAFLVYLIASLAEINRAPFDIPEAESELVSGFHTEYSGLRFSFFFMAEYANMFIVAALATLLFLGGWSPILSPFPPPVFWFLGKTYLLCCVMIWIRWTLPRYRVDQLMDLCWKYLVPIALANFLVTAVVAAAWR